MKRLHLTTALVFIVLTACTSADPDYTVPSRVSDHVASECPSIEGRYKNDSDPTLGSFPIFKRADGTLVLGANKPTDKDLPVTGEPTGDPHVGQQTAICQDGQIQIESNDKKDGHLRATLTPVGNNLSLYVKDDNGFNFTRTLRRL